MKCLSHAHDEIAQHAIRMSVPLGWDSVLG